MVDLITFGETMLRLNPSGTNRLEDVTQLEAHVGGAESNVAVNVARLGKQTAWFSKLPDNPLGYTVRNTIRHHGVDTSQIIWSDDERLGLYFVEFGQAPRSIQVWYDRADSAASHLTPDDLPLDAIADAKWLHLTGITPALSPTCAETVAVAIQHAQANNVKISFDVNYRALLWDAETAAQTITPFCQAADVVFVALRDAVNLFQAPDDFETCVKHLQKTWGGLVIISSGEKGVIGANETETATATSIETYIVDRLGAGDALASGMICRLLEEAPLADALQFGTVMAAFALSVSGDFARVTRAEVEARLQNDGGMIHR